MTQNKWLLKMMYFLLGLGFFLIFFYVHFPFDIVQKKMVRAFEIESSCRLEAQGQKVLFPLRFRWHNIRVLCPNSAQVLFDSIEANVAILPILLKQTGEIGFKIKIADQGGDIVGTLMVDPTPEGIAFSIKEAGVGAGVHIDYRGFSGILDTNGVGNWIGQDVLLGNGVFNFHVKDAHFRNQALPWPISDISFAKMTGRISWETGVVSVGDFSAEGETAHLTSRGGSLVLHEPFSESFISLAVNVSPRGQLKQVAELMIAGYSAKKPLTLNITGPLTAPKILLNGRRLPTAS